MSLLLNNFVCPNCLVKFKNSKIKNLYNKKCDDYYIFLYNGFCSKCGCKFFYTIDSYSEKTIFWKNTDEMIFENEYDFFKKVKNYNSISVLYLYNEENMNIDNINNIYKKYLLLSENCENSIIFIEYKYSHFVDVLNMRRNNFVFLINDDMFFSVVGTEYPCVLVERNILNIVNKWKKYFLYSNKDTFYNFKKITEE